MAVLNDLETKLEDVFKGAPKLSDSTKESLAKLWPWLALIFGILQLAAAWALWGLIRTSDRILDTANTISLYYTGRSVGYSSMDKFWIYLGVAMLVVDAVILLLAYPHLVKRARRGWDLLFLGSVINVVYSIVTIFISGRGFGSFLMGLIGSAVGFYLLFQVKSKYVKA